MAEYTPEERKAAREYLDRNAPSTAGCVGCLTLVLMAVVWRLFIALLL